MTVSGYKWHTIAATFDYICSGANIWVSIGNFQNDWWFYARDYRVELIKASPAPAGSKKMQCWAAFCTAMVETLCERCDIPIPEWTQQDRFVLDTPWFYYPDVDSRAELLATAPLSFKRRNVYVTPRVLTGKWDLPIQEAQEEVER